MAASRTLRRWNPPAIAGGCSKGMVSHGVNSRSVNGTATTYGVDDRNELTAGPDPAYGYDGNGNMTSKGMGSGTTYYTYDDENRLILATYSTSYHTAFAYDGLGRLRVRTEYAWNGSGWAVSSVVNYIYDGMRVVQERNSANTPTVAYARGLDLSGALEGLPRERSCEESGTGSAASDWRAWSAGAVFALSRGEGGIGGLLTRDSGYSGGSWNTHNFYHSDGNGNVDYIATTSLATAASYKYFPYGGLISSSDSIGNVYRFSSKEEHLNSGLYYYGYRFYAPGVQRWLNADPIGLWGGINLYESSLNDPLGYVDTDGRKIAYANHRVAWPFPWFHSKLIITPEDQARYAKDPRFAKVDGQGRHYATLGAGPDAGKLTSGVDRPADVAKPPCNLRVLPLPKRYSNEDEAIDDLLKLNQEYNKHREDYTLFPHLPWQYNSNSYLRSLLDAAGYDWFPTGANTPGWNNAIPPEDFGIPSNFDPYTGQPPRSDPWQAN
jgi:RHS repeat-associated protein